MSGKRIIKIVISVGMLALVLCFVDIKQLWHTMINIPMPEVVVVILGYALGQAISAYKWWVITNAGKIEASFTTALKSYFIGMYANCFGLGTIGGDLTRAVLLVGGRRGKTQALASVVADRVHGLAILALLGIVAVAFFGPNSLSSSWIYRLIAISGTVVIAWLAGPKLLLILIPHHSSLRDKAEGASAMFPRDIPTILWISLISLVVHLLQIGLHGVMITGFGLEIPWAALLVTIPFVNILSSLPVSWNGLGVREAGYLFFLSPDILTKEQVVALGAIWLVGVTINSAIGGIVSFLTGEFALVKSDNT